MGALSEEEALCTHRGGSWVYRAGAEEALRRHGRWIVGACSAEKALCAQGSWSWMHTVKRRMDG